MCNFWFISSKIKYYAAVNFREKKELSSSLYTLHDIIARDQVNANERVKR
jgi:hypothetical protein